MKLRITYEFDIIDMPSVGKVLIGDDDGYIAQSDTLQQALDRVHEYFVTQVGDDCTFDIVDVRPTLDIGLINREAALLHTMKAIVKEVKS